VFRIRFRREVRRNRFEFHGGETLDAAIVAALLAAMFSS
jgi:hypothetical protein